MEEEPLSDDFLNILFIEKMVFTSQSLSCDEKLKVLSKILFIFDVGEGPQCKKFQDAYGNQDNRNCFFQFLKYSLTDDQNRYVVFTARKVVTCLIKLYKSEKLKVNSMDPDETAQCASSTESILVTNALCWFSRGGSYNDGIKLLQDILSSRTHLDFVCTGLQICKELFSRKNSSHELMVSRLGDSIITAWRTLQTESENSEAYNHCLLEYFSVCTKLAKIVWSKDHEDSKIVFRQILSSGEELINILFQDSVKLYVKRKLIHFFGLILRPCDLTHDNPLYQNISRISGTVYNKLCSSDILKILGKHGQTSFIGASRSDCGVHDASSSYDTVHVREWTFLCFCAIAGLVKQPGYKDNAVMFLLRLDGYVNELLSKHTCSPFTWLPDIYGDQDDMWIDVMLLLMEIFNVGNDGIRSCLTDETRDQHHILFLQFVETLGYDHLVVVDLLTSPETNFLRYLLKYLKHLYKTWKEFNVLTWKYVKEMTINESSEEVSSSEDGKADEEGEIQIPETVSKNAANIHAKNIESNAELVSSDVTNCLMNNDLDCVLNKDSQYSRNVLAYSSLTMISDAYGDDSNDDDNDGDDLDIEINEVTLNTDIKKPFDNKEECLLENQNMIRACQNSYTAENESERKTFVSVPLTTFNEIDKTSNDLQEGSVLIELAKSQDVDKGLPDDNASDSVLDRVMGMLIRTRMQVEKLRESDLINYNPAVLVNLIAAIEELYEHN